MNVPRQVLHGKRIVLRPNATEFVPNLRAAAIESMATVGRWMSWCHPGISDDECLCWYRSCDAAWNAGTEYEFSLFSMSGDYIGACGLNQFNRQNNFANLGYWVRESQQRQGYAVEAANILIKFGFGELALGRIEIVVAEENLASRQVPASVGARFEGVLRNRLVIHGVPTNAAMYCVVPNDDP